MSSIIARFSVEHYAALEEWDVWELREYTDSKLAQVENRCPKCCVQFCGPTNIKLDTIYGTTRSKMFTLSNSNISYLQFFLLPSYPLP